MPGPSTSGDVPSGLSNAAASFFLGAAAAGLALLPWLVTGMRLPLQSLWAVQTSPEDMPIALLPFSQYAVTEVLSLIVVGYGVAGLAVRVLAHRLQGHAVLVVGAGALVVHLLAATQATVAVGSGLAQRNASTVYVAALLAVVATAIAAGGLVLYLVARTRLAGTVVGLSALALMTGYWLANLLTSTTEVADSAGTSAAAAAARWVPAALVGAAIVWGGLRTRARAAAAGVALLLLWVVPAALTALTSAVGSRVLLPYPSELVGFGWEVLQAAALDPNLVLPPLLLAVVVAATGTAVRAAWPRLSARAA